MFRPDSVPIQFLYILSNGTLMLFAIDIRLQGVASGDLSLAECLTLMARLGSLFLSSFATVVLSDRYSSW